MNTKVSIIILVHNALRYVKECLNTLSTTNSVSYETIVVDNGSDRLSKLYLTWKSISGRIDKLLLSQQNHMFSMGNNIGSKLIDNDSTHVLLLNSDVRINSADWLRVLIDKHRRGATAYGCIDEPYLRADGYCILIDRDLYQEFTLDEQYPWWWSITKLQSQLLKAGFAVTAIREHERYIHHYGGKSGCPSATIVANDEITSSDVVSWFQDHSVDIIESL